MGTKISEFTTLDEVEVASYKDNLWVPTYCDCADPINNESNFRVSLGSIMNGTGGGAYNMELISQKWEGSARNNPLCLLAENVNYDIITGSITVAGTDGDMTILPIYTGDIYRNSNYNLDFSSFMNFIESNVHYKKWVNIDHHANAITVPFCFEAPAGKKLIGVGIKGSSKSNCGSCSGTGQYEEGHTCGYCGGKGYTVDYFSYNSILAYMCQGINKEV